VDAHFAFILLPFWGVGGERGGLIVPSLMSDFHTDILSTRIMTTRPNNNYRPPPPIPTQIPCVSIPQIIVVPSLMRHLPTDISSTRVMTTTANNNNNNNKHQQH
jgi:hypothetical protein